MCASLALGAFVLYYLLTLYFTRINIVDFFSEISFLRLVHMDLSANRITTLPVELRFMNSVVELSLGENPLSCPPANVSLQT